MDYKNESTKLLTTPIKEAEEFLKTLSDKDFFHVVRKSLEIGNPEQTDDMRDSNYIKERASKIRKEEYEEMKKWVKEMDKWIKED